MFAHAFRVIPPPQPKRKSTLCGCFFCLVLMVRSERYRLLGYEADERIAIGGAYSVDKHFRLARGSG